MDKMKFVEDKKNVNWYGLLPNMASNYGTMMEVPRFHLGTQKIYIYQYAQKISALHLNTNTNKSK